MMRTYALEMMLATLMVTCGLTLIAPGETFAMQHYGIMRRFIPETPGGLILILVGFLRWAAILRNGHAGRYTPLFRISGCAVGCGFWTTLAVTAEVAILVGDETTGPPLLLAVASTSAIFEIYCSMRGGEDAAKADSFRLQEWRRSKGEYNGGL